MEYLALVLGAISTALGYLLYRESRVRASAELQALNRKRELVAERKTSASLRYVHAAKERRIAELEARLVDRDPVELFDDIFGGVRSEAD